MLLFLLTASITWPIVLIYLGIAIAGYVLSKVLQSA